MSNDLGGSRATRGRGHRKREGRKGHRKISALSHQFIAPPLFFFLLHGGYNLSRKRPSFLPRSPTFPCSLFLRWKSMMRNADGRTRLIIIIGGRRRRKCPSREREREREEWAKNVSPSVRSWVAPRAMPPWLGARRRRGVDSTSQEEERMFVGLRRLVPFSPSSAGQKSNSSVNAVSIGYFNEHFSLSPTAQNAKE